MVSFYFGSLLVEKKKILHQTGIDIKKTVM